jgi:hypothetical protein
MARAAKKATFRKPIPVPKKPKVKRAGAGGFNSDVIVDMLHMYNMPFAAINPGASYRGLHDSIVNYGANYPHMMLCTHEETAVQIAHGYTRATQSGRAAAFQHGDLLCLYRSRADLHHRRDGAA